MTDTADLVPDAADLDDRAGPDLRPPRRRVLAIWAIRGLCLVALGIVAYLLVLSAAEQGRPAGCGPGSGCEAVLASRWGLWFGVPVSYPAAAAYAALLGASCFAGPRSRPAIRRVAWLAVVALAAVVAGSAVWFGWAQAVLVRAFCPWCTALHACGVAIALVVWRGVPVVRATENEGLRYDPDAQPRRRPRIAAAAGLLLGSGALVGGQFASEEPVRHQTVAFATGFGDIDTREFPVLGPPSSPNVLLMMSDYTCPHCRELHHLLDRARERYGPSSFALAIATVPLNTECNVVMRSTPPRHVNACAPARLATAVWRLAPLKFAEYDRWLFEPETPPTPADARRRAETLVAGGADALDRAMADGFVPRTLQRNVALYAKAGQGRLPKLIIPSGADASSEKEAELFDALEKRLRLKPVTR